MINDAIVLDLDDTLIDTSRRHFNVISDYLKFYYIDFFSFGEYLSLRKNNRLSNQQIIVKYFSSVANEFGKWWANSIEKEEFLRHDRQIVDTSLLIELVEKKRSPLILLSLRSNLETAEEQFKSFSFSGYFTQIYFLPHNSVNPKIEVLSFLKKKYNRLLFIGDSESDAEAARQSLVDFYGVMTGFYPLSVHSKFSDINQILKNILNEY